MSELTKRLKGLIDEQKEAIVESTHDMAEQFGGAAGDAGLTTTTPPAGKAWAKKP